MNHSHAPGDGIFGRGKIGFLPFNENFTLITGIIPKKDVHQRRLAGTIFSQQGADFSGIQFKGNIIIGRNIQKILRDGRHSNHWLAGSWHGIPQVMDISNKLTIRIQFKSSHYFNFKGYPVNSKSETRNPKQILNQSACGGTMTKTISF
jgi:hypothetical protein